MVTRQLDDVILKIAKESKTLCKDINQVCGEIKDVTNRMMIELKDLTLKQDYLITNIRDEYYRLGQERYDYERDYLTRE